MAYNTGVLLQQSDRGGQTTASEPGGLNQRAGNSKKSMSRDAQPPVRGQDPAPEEVLSGRRSRLKNTRNV